MDISDVDWIDPPIRIGEDGLDFFSFSTDLQGINLLASIKFAVHGEREEGADKAEFWRDEEKPIVRPKTKKKRSTTTIKIPDWSTPRIWNYTPDPAAYERFRMMMREKRIHPHTLEWIAAYHAMKQGNPIT